jgi:hypothetical protein
MRTHTHICVQDLNFRHYLMKLKITNETYNDETKLRTSVVTVTPPNFVTEGKVSIRLQPPVAPTAG